MTRRGNGRAQTFFNDDDYRFYLNLLSEHTREADVAVWAGVLMPNHVHLILTPKDADGIRRALSRTHRRYAGYIHARLKRTGHFWRGRFGCVAMDESHLAGASRYVALNPVRARLCRHAEDWPRSSVHAQLGHDGTDTVTEIEAVRRRFPDFAAMIAEGEDEEMSLALRRAETIGRPLGDAKFLERLERQTGRRLKPARRGPKPEAN